MFKMSLILIWRDFEIETIHVLDQSSMMTFLRNEFLKISRTFLRWRKLHEWLIFIIKRINKYQSLRLEVKGWDILNLFAVKCSLKNYWTEMDPSDSIGVNEKEKWIYLTL